MQRFSLQSSAVVLVVCAALLDGAVAQEPAQPPAPAHVSTRAQIEALPADTKWLVGTGIEDDDVDALLRLRDLERLELRAVVPSPHTPGETVKPMSTLGDAGMQLLTGLQSLRVLELRYQTELTERAFRWLVQLRGLRTLELDWCHIDDRGVAALTKLPELATLRLTSCSGIGRAAFDRLAEFPALRSLDLSCNPAIEEEWLLRLGKLPKLERLNLTMVGVSRYWTDGPLDPGRARPEPAVTDRVLEALTAAKTLRDLDLSYAPVSAEGIAVLGRLPLDRLVLRGVPVTPEILAKLPSTLRQLDLSDNASVSDACIVGLARLEGLRSLALGRCSGLTVAATVPALLRLRALRQLDLRGVPALTEAHLVELRALPDLECLATDFGIETFE